MVLCLNWEILHCVQDDEIAGVGNVIPNVMEGSPECGVVPVMGDQLHCVQDLGISGLLRMYFFIM
ncbi:hypothetical protein [Legionella quateirensis]|uniref:hypothetical protein n=1 Tax=Legionella quateirensis TaxID=45072 RepID=UPI00073028DC|nr:hypothetical protein [Legionella quateirensis]